MRVVIGLTLTVLAALLLASKMLLGAPTVQTTGELSFMDSHWAQLGQSYPPGADSAYVELNDADANKHVLDYDSVAVTVRSEMGDVETLYLRETSANSGVFRATIAFDLQASSFVKYLKSAYPEGLPKGEEGQAVYQGELARWSRRSVEKVATAGDGKLQIAAGNDLVVEYHDPVNDWGEEELITAHVIYGGWEGYVSGTWTVANSPYVLVGDIRIGTGYSLTIEAGVRVLAMPDVMILVLDGATLRAMGTPSDSVHFDAKSAVPADSDFWGGINNSYSYSSGTPLSISLSYVEIKHALTGLSYSTNSGELLMSHCRVSESGDASGYYTNRAVFIGGSGNYEISECAIVDNVNVGIQLSAPNGIVKGGEISGNARTGIRIQNSPAQIQQVSILNNVGDGVSVELYNSGQQLSIHQCSIYGNSGYDILNDGSQDVDARFNWWGNATTAQINNGLNPKNITKIFDYFDYSYRGKVRYGGCINCAESGVTGEVMLTDAYWMEIGSGYPPGSEAALVELRDADLNVSAGLIDNAMVEFSSEFGDEELLLLQETAANSGVFRGSIAFDLQVDKLAKRMRVRYPDGFNSDQEYQQALRQEMEATLTKSAGQSLGDGVLQVSAGGWLKVEYADALNEWGSSQSTASESIYGGWAGYVGGNWTSSGNPYIIVGDITVGSGYSLTIGPGVRVEFMPEVSLFVLDQASLQVLGSSSDSVYFTAKTEPEADSELWGGTRLSSYSGNGHFEASYLVVEDAFTGVYQSNGQATMKMSHCRVSDCGSSYYYSGNEGVYATGPCEITDCVFNNNRGHGLSLSSASGTVRGGEASGNSRDGILVQSSLITIEQTKVLNNEDNGLEITGYNGDYLPTIRHCQLFGNEGWDIYCNTQYDIDAKYNWWGEATTLEMKTGSNPKNISKIYDEFDYSYLGIVKYGGWMKFPFVVGDINGSFSVNITDAVGLMQYLFAHGAAPTPIGSGDSNCDGRINLTDVVYIINFIFSGGPEPGAACP